MTLAQRIAARFRAAEGGEDRSTNGTVVEYAIQTMMKKRKSPSAAAKDTAKKFDGFENMFFGPGISRVDPKKLEGALWARLVENVIQGMKKIREGKEHFALDGTIQHFNQADAVRKTLKQKVVQEVGSNPFTNDDQA